MKNLQADAYNENYAWNKKSPLRNYPSRVKVGSFTEEQLKNKEDKIALGIAQENTGYSYVITRIVKQRMDIYLISDKEYYQSSEF